MCWEASWTASFPIVMLAQGEMRSVWPQLAAGQPQKEQGVVWNSAQLGSPLPPRTMSYLWPPVNVYKAGPASSWSVQRPAPSPGSCFLLARQGRGTVTGRKNPAPRGLGNPTSPVLPRAVPGSASPLAGAGMSSGTQPARPALGISAYRRRGGKVFLGLLI